MKKVVLMVFVVSILLLDACSPGVKILSKKSDYRLFHEYLLKVVRDTNRYEVPALKIVDEDLYPILDSAINSTEQCEYFDKRIPYLHAFYISAIKKNGRLTYSIDTHRSIYSVLGLLLNWAEGKNEPMDVGVFYYKNYLFAVSVSPYLKQIGIAFPFCVQTDCNYQIFAPELYKEKVYNSYVNFVKKNDKYVIVENKVCGGEILY